MRCLWKLNIKNSFNNARSIADYMCIALMRYSIPGTSPTFCATIRSNRIRNILHSLIVYSSMPSKRIDDNTVSWYTIRIYKMYGNRSSILSPVSNKHFNKCVLSDEILNAMTELTREE